MKFGIKLRDALADMHVMKPLRYMVSIAAVAAGIASYGPSSTALASDVATGVSVVSLPSSIDATGSTDVSASLEQFLQAVPAGTEVEFPTNGQFRLSDTVGLVDKQRLTLDGNGSTIFVSGVGYRERADLAFEGGSNLVVADLNIRGVNLAAGADGPYDPNLEGQHGIRLRGVQGMRIENVNIRQVWGDFVYVGRELRRTSPLWGQPSRDVTIIGNDFAKNGRQGIAVTGGSRVGIFDNDITDTRRATIDLEPNNSSWTVDNVSVVGNRIGVGRLTFLAAAGDGPVDDILVKGNVLTGHPMNMIVNGKMKNSRTNWTIVGNISDRVFGSPLQGVVQAVGVRELTFQNNVQPMAPRRNMYGVAATGSCGLQVDNNTLVGAAGQLLGASSQCAEGPATAVVQPAEVSMDGSI